MKTNKKELLDSFKGGLIVSCQVQHDDPTFSVDFVVKMAKAAQWGGAAGIRANDPEQIKAIKKEVDLPVIGIIKREYGDCPVFITPTMKEIDELIEGAHPEIVALDATCRVRPDGRTLDELYADIRAKYPEQKLMADCSTLEECLHAAQLGFDFVGTTLVGYTEESKGDKVETNDFELMRKYLEQSNVPMIAEGNIDTPEKARRVLELGCFSVVVGSIITRPQLITKRFVDCIEG